MFLAGKTIPANLNQETTGDLNCGTINMTEEQRYKSDANGIVSGTVQDTSDHLIPPRIPKNESLYLPISVNGIPTNSLLDSGSTLTVIHPDIYSQISTEQRPALAGNPIKLRMADGGLIKSLGRIQIEIAIEGMSVKHSVVVAEVESPVVLGYDFLNKYNSSLDFGDGTLSISGNKFHCLRLNQLEETIRLTVGETITLPPYSESIDPATLIQSRNATKSDALYVKPLERFLNKNVVLAKMVFNSEQTQVPLRIANLSEEPLNLQKHTLVATGEPATVLDSQLNNKDTKGGLGSHAIPYHLQEMWNESCKNLSLSQRDKAATLLVKVQDVFSRDKSDLGRTHLVTHHINTGDSPPIKQAPRRLPLSKRAEAEAEVDKMLQKGIIKPSNSPWSSPTVLVRKKDGSIRFCIDYRKLNHVTVKDSYPLPRIDDSLDALGNAKWFSTLDLTSGYWQVEVHPNDVAKTAFVTTSGLYQFRVLPFGLTNAPATFQRLMECVLAGLQWRTCLLYLDDIIIFSSDFDDHLVLLLEILSRIQEAGLKLNPKKCHLFCEKVAYLGHIVSACGIATDPDKVKAVVDWPCPKCLSDIRSFLGLCSYYRRFIPYFSTVAQPLF